MNPQLLSFKKLTIIPSGYVQNGFVQYRVDTDSGLISYQYELNVKVWLIPYNAAGSGTTKVDPAQLLSANLSVGQKLVIGPVTAIVKSIQDGKAVCSLTIVDESNSINESGEIVLDVSKKYLDIISLNEAGTVKGFAINIQTVE